VEERDETLVDDVTDRLADVEAAGGSEATTRTRSSSTTRTKSTLA